MAVYPVSCLDTPQAIILHGSDVVPWSWSMWTDDRVADIEAIDYIVRSIPSASSFLYIFISF